MELGKPPRSSGEVGEPRWSSGNLGENLGGSRGTSGELVELQGACRTSAEPGEFPGSLGNLEGARKTSGILGRGWGITVELREPQGVWGISG